MTVCIHPEPGDHPTRKLVPEVGIPTLNLGLHTSIRFSSARLGHAREWLDELARQAVALSDEIGLHDAAEQERVGRLSS